VWVNGVDKSFQEKQGAPENIGEQTEEPPQPMDDCQAKEIAMRKAEVENMRRKVEEAMRNADNRTMMKWKAEAKRRAEAEARAAELKAKAEAEAEDAKRKAEAAEREAEAAEREAEAVNVVVLEAVSGLEKAAASEVASAASRTASKARYMADGAADAAKAAAKATPWLWA
jgi:membrane protein involved in colicin uptake